MKTVKNANSEKCTGNFKLLQTPLVIDDFDTMVRIWKETVPALVLCHSDKPTLRAFGSLLDSVHGEEVFKTLRWYLLKSPVNKNLIKVIMEQLPGSPRQLELFKRYATDLVKSEIAAITPKKKRGTRVYNGHTGYIAPRYVQRLQVNATI